MARILTTLLSKAIALAVEAHDGHADAGGKPYILHPLRIMVKMSGDDLQTLAVLHDVLEDTRSKEPSERITVDDLRKIGLDELLIDAIIALTKEEGENYQKYLSRVKDNWRSLTVKIADLEDNLNLPRIPNPSAKDLERIEKYKKALKSLKKKEELDKRRMEKRKEEGMFRALIQFEGATWYVDLTDDDHWEIKIMDPDGTWRNAITSDGNFMEALNMGMVISREKITF